MKPLSADSFLARRLGRLTGGRHHPQSAAYLSGRQILLFAAGITLTGVLKLTGP